MTHTERAKSKKYKRNHSVLGLKSDNSIFNYPQIPTVLLKGKTSEFCNFYNQYKQNKFTQELIKTHLRVFTKSSTKQSKKPPNPSDILSNLTKTADLLYDSLLISNCDRVIDSKKDIFISHHGYDLFNKSEFKSWLCDDDYYYPNLSKLLIFNPPSSSATSALTELHHAFLYLQSLNLIQVTNGSYGILKIFYPINDKLLPLVYAYISLLSHYKKRKRLETDIIDTIKKTPKLLKKKYNKLTKKELIQELIARDIDTLEKENNKDIDKIRKTAPIFKEIMQELTNYVIPQALQTYLEPYKKGKDLYTIQDAFNDFFEEITEEMEDVKEYKEDNIIKENIMPNEPNEPNGSNESNGFDENNKEDETKLHKPLKPLELLNHEEFINPIPTTLSESSEPLKPSNQTILTMDDIINDINDNNQDYDILEISEIPEIIKTHDINNPNNPNNQNTKPITEIKYKSKDGKNKTKKYFIG